jgi:hypothetical protein
MQQTFVGRAKSITGTAFIGLGVFVLYENLHQAATQFSRLLGVIPMEAVGVLPSIILAASAGWQAYGADHARSLQGSLLGMLESFWPVLLVIIGTALSRDCSMDNVNALPKKDCGLVDLTARRSTSEWREG